MLLKFVIANMSFDVELEAKHVGDLEVELGYACGKCRGLS